VQRTTAAESDGLYLVAEDVTRRRTTEIERGQIAGLSQAITDSVADGLWVADSDGSILYVNPSGLRMLGYEADELIGRDYHAALHHSRADGSPFPVEERPLLAGRGTGAAYEAAEDCFWRKDGSMMAVVYSSSSLPLASGAGSVVVFRDISAQRGAAPAQHEAELAIRRSEALHRTLTANLPDTSVFLIDHDLRVLVADGEAIRRLPWSDQDMFRGREVSELHAEVPKEILRLSLENYRAALQGERRGFEFDSGGLTFAVQAVPVRAEDGSVESALVVARDITERTRAVQQLARQARQQKAVAKLGRFALESHDLGMLMTEAVRTTSATLRVDMTGVLEFDEASESLAFVAALGAPEHAVGAQRVSLSDSPISEQILRTGEPVIIEDLTAEGRFAASPTWLALGVVSSVGVPIECHDRPFGILAVYTREARRFSEDEVGFLTGVAALITVAVERVRDEQATRHAALHDSLTGLPNRTLALDRLEQALAHRRREGIDVAVFALDVDRFKNVNDSFGHAAGDEVLLALALRLTGAVRPSDTVARIGGDEFVVICPAIDGAREATEVAERLAGAAIHPPLVLESGEHILKVSIGITLTGHHDTPGSLLRDADAAMYRAKERGRGRYELFDKAMRTEVVTRIRTETELRGALDNGELTVWFQPVIDLATGQPVSTEALARWEHPSRGLIAPCEFIPIAEEIGLIGELGLHVLEEACRQTAAWQQQFDTALGVSVNVSGRQATNPVFPAQAASIAERSGLRPGALALEITESVLMEEADSPATILRTMQEYGLTLALDDFGTGYSSLSRLKRFPLDVLKIDRSFVSGVDSNTDDRAIVKATIDMAHAVALTVVAEGVETREQEDCLRAFGCDGAQGYLYARPQPAQAITAVLAAASR
jgi:diguanylate cyclase (GGDEF)-like protein/PAS domain S-box-containing protein